MDCPNFTTLLNFRDLSAYPCAYGEMTPGVIYRSASPYYANEDDLKRLKDIGIRSVIDLRGAVANSHEPSPFMNDPDIEWKLFSLPSGEKAPDTEEEMPGLYMALVSDPFSMRAVFKAVLNSPKPMLIHCESGKDRTGMVCLLLLLANGVSREDACRDYNLSYDGRLAMLEKAILSYVPNLPSFHFHASPKIIETFMDQFLERYETIENYFEAIGLTDGEIDGLKNLFGVQHTSCGAVVFHGDKVLVEHMALGHYSMPKGHVESGDGSYEETALREIKEETGLTARIVPGLRSSSTYSWKPGHIKRVNWFLAEVDSEAVTVQMEEVQAVYFLSPADALRVLSHDDDRRVLTEACAVRYSK